MKHRINGNWDILHAQRIAHDINNLLGGTCGHLSLTMNHVPTGDKTFKYLAKMEKSINGISGLVKELQDMFKGKKQAKMACFAGDTIMAAADLALGISNVKCEFSLSDGLWNTEIDKSKMDKIIYNLILNAVQAMPQGGTVNVIAQNTVIGKKNGLPLKDGRYIRISIKDQGTGIPEDIIQHIFDPYFTTKEKGTGLGLARVYSIVKDSGGHIAVDSQLGVGTTFIVYLRTRVM